MIRWFPRPQVSMIAAGPAEPVPLEDRCWADEPTGHQCATVIDEGDRLGLCDRHRVLLRDAGDTGPPVELRPIREHADGQLPDAGFLDAHVLVRRTGGSTD